MVISPGIRRTFQEIRVPRNVLCPSGEVNKRLVVEENETESVKCHSRGRTPRQTVAYITVSRQTLGRKSKTFLGQSVTCFVEQF